MVFSSPSPDDGNEEEDVDILFDLNSKPRRARHQHHVTDSVDTQKVRNNFFLCENIYLVSVFNLI